MNLYKVTLRGMKSNPGGTIYGIAYVVAGTATKAERIMIDYLDEGDIGFSKDRVLEKIELLAEEGQCPDCGTILYLQHKKIEERRGE